MKGFFLFYEETSFGDGGVMKPLFERCFLSTMIVLFSGVVFLVLFASFRWGLGQTWDSVEYLVSALSLAQGDGFLVIGKAGLFAPMAYRLPFYSMVLSAGLFLGFSLAAWAVFLNIVCFMVTLGCIALSVLKTTGRAGLALCTVLFVALLPHVVLVHLYVWSEPLFLALTALSFLCFIMARERRALIWVCMAAFFAGLSLMTRYAGLPVIIAGGWASWFIFREEGKKMLLAVGIFWGVSCLFPVMYFLVRTMMLGTPHVFSWGMFLSIDKLRWGVDTLSCWFFPASTPFPVRFLCFLCVAGYVIKKVAGWRVLKDHPGAMMLSFSAGYAVMIMFSAFAIAQDVKLDPRLMVPILICAGVVFPIVLLNGRKAGVVLFSFLLLIGALRTGQLVMAHHLRGAGYSGQEIQENRVSAEVKAIADNLVIYSDDPAAFYSLTGRVAVKVPSIIEDPFYLDIPIAVRALKERRALVVLFQKDMEKHPWWKKAEQDAGLEILLTDGKESISGRRAIKG